MKVIIKQIEIIGEAANNLSQQIRDQFTEIQWSQIIGMRNVLVHEYFGIAVRLIWQVILTDLPDLKTKITQILDTLITNESINSYFSLLIYRLSLHPLKLSPLF